jgi:hypothetical protein
MGKSLWLLASVLANSCDLFIIVYNNIIRNNLVQLFNSPAILPKYLKPEFSLDLAQLFNSQAILQKYLKPEISLDYNVMSPTMLVTSKDSW